MATVYLGLGSNLGDRAANLRRALAALEAARGDAGDQVARVEAVSSLYETEPVGYQDQPDFLNGVARIQTQLAPRPLLTLLKAIEGEVGRTPTFHQGPRVVDLDLLLYDLLVLHDGGLRIPHPGLEARAFVLVPLAELAPAARHPVLGLTATELLARLGPVRGVTRWGPMPDWRTDEGVSNGRD